MGHLSSYTNAQLRLPPSGGGVPVPSSIAKCGTLQPDMKRWLSQTCDAEWMKRMQDEESDR